MRLMLSEPAEAGGCRGLVVFSDNLLLMRGKQSQAQLLNADMGTATRPRSNDVADLRDGFTKSRFVGNGRVMPPSLRGQVRAR